MGAVQKLATVVIIGLVALATVLTVYIAREPDRRDTELSEQDEVSIVRGTELYITYCLQCHGPGGGGYAANEDRQGPPLNTEFFTSDDPVQQQTAENLIRHRLINGAPSDIRLDKVMPSFQQDLNVEQMNELVTLILNGNWDYVYNSAVTETGVAVAEAECEETDGEPEYCDNIEEAPPVYPTAPPSEEEAEEEAEAGPDASEDVAGEDAGELAPEGDSGDAAAAVEADDPAEWSTDLIVARPGDTIAVTNVGNLQHDFTVDELGIAEDLPTGGEETVMITIPEDAEAGDYEFYCSVPGHREQGMFGTLTIEGA